jgi:intracellular septation protein
VQALYDFLPVVAFFATLKLADIYVATGVLMVATVAVAVLQWLRRRTVSPMLLFSAGLGLLFGGLTLWFHNELFIKWKPTVLYALLAALLLASQLLSDKPILQKMLEQQLSADDRTWRTVNLSWALFFLALAAANLVFVYRFSTDAWAIWKLATLALTFVYAFASSLWLAQRAHQPKP